MAQDVEIQCINKRDRLNPHERIENVGGILNGQLWKLTEDQAIAGIKSGSYSFYTTANGLRATVYIGRHLGREYLTTSPDGTRRNNLLDLPECP